MYIKYIIDFSLGMLYRMENDVNSVIISLFGADWENFNLSTVMKSDKGTLANLVLSAFAVLGKSKGTLRSAAVTMEQLKSELFDNQKSLLNRQNEPIQSNDDCVKFVQLKIRCEVLVTLSSRALRIGSRQRS